MIHIRVSGEPGNEANTEWKCVRGLSCRERYINYNLVEGLVKLVRKHDQVDVWKCGTSSLCKSVTKTTLLDCQIHVVVDVLLLHSFAQTRSITAPTMLAVTQKAWERGYILNPLTFYM